MNRAAALPLVIFLAIGPMAGCASTGATPRPFPTPGGHAGAPGAPVPSPPARVGLPDSTGYAIAGSALALRGAPYRAGGHDPSGFDCSGLVQYVFAQHGISLPRTVGEQFRAGHPIAPDQLEPGDLVFFTTTDRGASHVGIALGGDEFVHAPSERGEVRVERLSTPYWSSRFVAVKRVT
jgi:cell wall-associated NlpC family hydrolase